MQKCQAQSDITHINLILNYTLFGMLKGARYFLFK